MHTREVFAVIGFVFMFYLDKNVVSWIEPTGLISRVRISSEGERVVKRLF